jgi:hypothetical protein
VNIIGFSRRILPLLQIILSAFYRKNRSYSLYAFDNGKLFLMLHKMQKKNINEPDGQE